jgi:CheY-like chemotaxis protein
MPHEVALALVVEDDVMLCELLENCLQSFGYRVETATQGALALDLARTSSPDVIVLDLQMPVMDGAAFSDAYRDDEGRHAPIVVLSGVAHAEELAARIGAVGIVRKPFDLEELRSTLSRAVEQSREN